VDRLDDRLFLAVNSFARHTPWLHDVAVAYAKYGVVLFALALGCGALIARGRPARTLAAALWAPAATLLALAANQPLGNLVAEQRPYAAHPGALLLVPATTDFSFPSDHAVVAGAVAAGILVYDRRLGWATAVAAFVMAADRVYVGAHYPGDVVAGLTLGACVAWLSWLAASRPLTWLVSWLRSTRLRPLMLSARRRSALSHFAGPTRMQHRGR
jgi:membrane-associated phospholipid phosphatase